MFHKYRYKDLNILLDANNGSIHLIDDVAFDLLDYDDYKRAKVELSNKYTNEELEQAISEIEELKREGIFDSEDKVFNVFNNFTHKPVIKAMCLHVSHDCNLRCKYCFASQGDFKGAKELMDLDTGKKALEFLCKSSGNRRNLEVDFFGGEPLMNFEVVKKLVEYGRILEKEYNKNFRFTMTTNGMLLSDDVIDYLNENMDNVVLSLDGTRDTNDNMRPTINGKSSYDIIVPKFQKFVEKRGDKSYYIRGTYTAESINFCEDVVHMSELGFKSLSMEPVVSEPGLSYTIDESHLPVIYEQYEKLADEMISRKNTDRDFRFFHFEIDLEGGPCPIKKASGCGAGCEYISVTPKGDIYPCHQFVSDPSFLLGNLETGIVNPFLTNSFKNMNVFTKDDCQKCWAKYYCSGGCHANAYNFNQSLSKPYEIGCKMQRKRLEIAIYLKIREMLDDIEEVK